MNSLKTGVIIAFGLTVLYGVYLVINKPQPTAEAKAEADAVEDLSIGEVEMEESSDVALTDEENDSASKESLVDDSSKEGNAPAAVVADRNRRGSRYQQAESTESPNSTDPAATENETDETNTDLQDSEKSESAAKPWQRQPKSEPIENENAQEDADANPRSRFRDEEPNQEEEAEPPQTEQAKDGSQSDSKVAEDEEQESAKSEVKIAPREAPTLGAAEFDAAWTKMEQEIEDEKLKEALATISPFFHSADLSDDDRKQLLEVLDLLAWRVVFSKEHFLVKPHIVAAGETLDDISARYEVPSEVIAKINGIKSAKLLTAGTELKVLPGPFRAEVSPEKGELTLFLGDLYATQYALEIGTEPPPMPGEYEVVRRATGAVYPTRAGREIAAQDPRNPYGGVFLDLGDNQCIHGSPEKESGEALGTGCMRLRGKDANEVYWLLSKGSKVSVLK